MTITLDRASASAALTGNRGLLEDQIGFEVVSRAARLVMGVHLNDYIVKNAERWGEEDLQLQRLGFDEGVGQVELAEVPLSHIHEGPHPSILTASADEFPRVAVMGYTTSPAPAASQFDQFDTVTITLAIEAFAIAGPVSEGLEARFGTIVKRRIARLTEAYNAALRSDPTMLGTVDPIAVSPTGGISQAAFLKRPSDAGPKYLIHGSRLQYTLQRQAAF